MRRSLEIVMWILVILFMGFGLGDLLYFQPHRAEIRQLIQATTDEERNPSAMMKELVQASTSGNLDYTVARILLDKLDVRPSADAKFQLGKMTTFLFWTLLVELHLSEQERITLYMGYIHTGNLQRGFSAASQSMFHKPLAALSPEEAATIAVIPRSPSVYFEQPELLKKHRDDLLSKLKNEH
jgi:membrane carboxypeptidase/penicillin-binding protein PbpC